jgi:HAD superfamily hydrolase (TIGR01509 family)
MWTPFLNWLVLITAIQASGAPYARRVEGNVLQPVAAVVFDLDGLLLDSEQVWREAKERLVHERGGRWSDAAEHDMLGMSSTEWARYMRNELGVPLDESEISSEVVRIMGELYERELPILPGADDAVRRIAGRWPLGLASSSNREIIDLVLREAGWLDLFDVTVASEEVARGKPSPDVYLEAARRLGVSPTDAVAVEDSGPGIRSAHAASLAVVAIPNPAYPPEAEVLEPTLVLASLSELDPAAVERAAEEASP